MKAIQKDIRSQEEAIMMTVIGISRKAGKGYCWPSQEHILELMDKYHGVVISRRTLNRRLDELESGEWFKRVRRIARGQDGRLVMRSTLYKLLGRAYAWVGRLGRWAVGVARVFRVPKLAHNYSLRERRVSAVLSPDVGFIEIMERDGTVSRFHPRTGEYE